MPLNIFLPKACMTQVLSWLYSRSETYEASNFISKVSEKMYMKEVSDKKLIWRNEKHLTEYCSDLFGLGRIRVAGGQSEV